MTWAWAACGLKYWNRDVARRTPVLNYTSRYCIRVIFHWSRKKARLLLKRRTTKFMAIISTIFSAFCFVMLFTGSFAPICQLEDIDGFESPDQVYDCVWEEWGHWSSCSNGEMERRRWKVPRDDSILCRCPEWPDIQTRSCSIIVRWPGEYRNLGTEK